MDILYHIYKMVYSLTHEVDLDGLGSQAILLRYFSLLKRNGTVNINLDFAHYTNFISKVTQILKSNLPNKLIITDIGFNNDFVSLFPLFEEAKNNGTQIYWFDHHLIDSTHEQKLKKLIDVYLIDPTRCGAEIVKDYYLPRDEIALKIAKLAHDIDFRKGEYDVSQNLQSIISFNRGDEKELKRIVKYLSQGHFENKWFEIQLEKSKNWEESEKVNIIENRRKFEINESYELILSTASIGGGRITTLLQEKHPSADIFIGIDSRFDEVIVYSNIFNCRELAKSFKGGGHKNRAGFHYKDALIKENQVNLQFLREIKNQLKKILKKSP